MAWLRPSRATAPAGPLSTEVRLSMEHALRLMTDFLDRARAEEDESADKVVLTLFAHPPADQD